MEAPNDLAPRRTTFSLKWAPPGEATLEDPATITVVVDPDDRYDEITEENNTALRNFPRQTKRYRRPRLWPSFAEGRDSGG